MGRRTGLYLVLATMAVMVASLFDGDGAGAIIRRRTITPEVDTGLRIHTDGRHVSMTGPMACDPGENWEVRANLTQAGNRGNGRSEGVCRGDIQEWVVRVAVAADPMRFTPGPARGCAVLRTLNGSTETDRHDWCNDIRLVSTEGGSDGVDRDGTISWVALALGGVAVIVALAALARSRGAG
jgi:hypothetical protein